MRGILIGVALVAMRTASIAAFALAPTAPSIAGSSLDAPPPTSQSAVNPATPVQVPSPDEAFQCQYNLSFQDAYDALVRYWSSQFGPAWHRLRIQRDADGVPLIIAKAAPIADSPMGLQSNNVPVHNDALVELFGFHSLVYLAYRNPAKDQWRWIQWDPDFVAGIAKDGSSGFAPVVAIAHEVGHHVQDIGDRSSFMRRGPDSGSDEDRPKDEIKHRELDADRLAGAFMGYLVHTVGVPESCYKSALRALSAHADPPGSNPAHPHGTAQERMACLQYGFLKGPRPFMLSQPRGNTVIDCNDLSCSTESASTDEASADRNAMLVQRDPSCPNNPEPKIGPPVITQGPSCIKLVFEESEGCACPNNYHPTKLGKGPPNMIWCRWNQRARM